MQYIEVGDLETQTTEILRNVREARAEYIVTYRGEPMAQLLPVAKSSFGTVESTTRQALADQIDQTLIDKPDLASSNRQMLEIYRDWLTELGEVDNDEWWKEFDSELAKNRFHLRQEAL